MKKKVFEKTISWVFVGLFAIYWIFFGTNEIARAESHGLTLSPMNQSVVIDPGDSRESSFLIANPSSASSDVWYELSVEPFYITDDGKIYYEAEGDSGEITNWITFGVPLTGRLVPNEKMSVSFTIDVPKSAPAGGQYIAIIITMKEDGLEQDTGEDDEESGVTIKEVKRMAHLVYAEITGEVNKKGEIVDASVSSFLFSGNITGSSMVKNLGNVHGTAKYTLQVFPLFSDEEVFSNVEEPDTKKVLPDRSVYRELSWEETPSVGIYNVIYNVEFEGATAQIKKLVIICPLWLLFVILFVVAMIIMWLIIKAKQRKKE